MDLHISDGDIAALDRSTEGWIAGIQLAALLHQRAPGSLSMPEVGGHRAVLDYLATEVLRAILGERIMLEGTP